MSVTSYLYDPVRIVTSPGANALDPFSPPSGFSGSAGDYRLLLVSRYRVPASRRYIMAHAKALLDGLNVIFEGPYTMEAADILEKIVASDRMQETKRAMRSIRSRVELSACIPVRRASLQASQSRSEQ